MNATTKIEIPAEVLDLVRGSLAPKNSAGIASVRFYEAALAGVGVDPESLSFSESVEVTRRLYAASADFRRAAREDSAKAREAKAEAARAAKALANADRDEKREVAGVESLEKLGVLDADAAKNAKAKIAAKFAKIREGAK